MRRGTGRVQLHRRTAGGILTNPSAVHILDEEIWDCAIVTARSTFLCMETLSLHRLAKGSSGIGSLAASSAAVVHVAWSAGVFVACCCACDVSSVHLQEMFEPGATAYARLEPPHALHGAFVASLEHECRPCDRRTQTVSVALRKPLLKTPIPSRILKSQVPPPSDRFGASPVVYAYSLSGRSEATLQMVRVTVLLI